MEKLSLNDDDSNQVNPRLIFSEPRRSHYAVVSAGDVAGAHAIRGKTSG